MRSRLCDNPPGAEKKFFYAVLEIREPPPVSPTIDVVTESPTVITGANPEIIADSSIGFRITWSNHSSAQAASGSVGANVVCVEDPTRRCEERTDEIVEIRDDNTVEPSGGLSKTIIVGSGGFREEASTGQKVVVGYRRGAMATRTGAYTDENTGWSPPVPISFPASRDLGRISVGAGDARTLQLFPATDVSPPTDSEALFNIRTNTNWGLRLALADDENDEGHWRWSATSSSPSVATVRMNADTDDVFTDDSVIITGVYGGDAATTTSVITVVGVHYIPTTATDDPADAVAPSGDRLEEKIKVTVLKNRAPIFTVTDASVSWPENAVSCSGIAAENYAINLMNSFVASGFVSDEDAKQALIFNFLDADGNVIAASGNEMTSKSSSTGFQVQSTGDERGKITAQCVGGSSQVSFERYANGEVQLTVQASDGHGGTDVLDLTIQVTDENDEPRLTREGEKEFSHAALVDNTGARTANVNLTPYFIDEDGDRLCYRIKPNTMSPNFDMHATASLAGAADCHLPRLTLTMKSALTQGTPGVGNPIAGKTGVEEIMVAVDVFELVQADPTNKVYSDAKTLTSNSVWSEFSARDLGWSCDRYHEPPVSQQTHHQGTHTVFDDL